MSKRRSSNASQFTSQASETYQEAIPPNGAARLDRISRRAYELYEARGGVHGRSIDDWLQAEREIDSEVGRS